MKATDELVKEHEAIKLMLSILEQVCLRIDQGEKIIPTTLDNIVEFIRVFADKCHHGKEEDLLFPAMVKMGIPQNGGPIGVMLSEHKMGRDFVKGMLTGIDYYKENKEGWSFLFSENARKYIQLLRQHIDKEDNILYPMANQRLSSEQQKELLRQFENVEVEIVGAGKHEEFHELLRQLKEKFLQ
ncbi:MAG: hemerythrin domain-containing protein [Candidatus Thorarchaeota archaeon]